MQQDQPKNLMPSKKFLIRGGIATGALILILIVQTSWFTGLFNRKPLSTIAVRDTTTVGDIVGKDSNNNGIADWEENLWGLDPTVSSTNGISNKQIIEQKRRALGITDTSDENENETDLLAKQLLTISTAVGQSEQGSTLALQAIGADLGDGIDFSQVSNHYTISNVTTVKTSVASLQAYSKALSTIMAKYSDESAGISVVITALETGDTSRLPELKETGAMYMALARQLQKVPAPVGISDSHLALMNGFYGIGQSFDFLLQMDENGVYGIVGIGIYKEYALRTDQAFSDIRDYFLEYGILKP